MNLIKIAGLSIALTSVVTHAVFAAEPKRSQHRWFSNGVMASLLIEAKVVSLSGGPIVSVESIDVKHSVCKSVWEVEDADPWDEIPGIITPNQNIHLFCLLQSRDGEFDTFALSLDSWELNVVSLDKTVKISDSRISGLILHSLRQLANNEAAGSEYIEVREDNCGNGEKCIVAGIKTTAGVYSPRPLFCKGVFKENGAVAKDAECYLTLAYENYSILKPGP